MRILVGDPGLGAEVWHDVPDEPIQKFLNFIMTSNRWKYDENPELLLERLGRLRAALWRSVREQEAEVQRAAQAAESAAVPDAMPDATPDAVVPTRPLRQTVASPKTAR